MRQLSYGRTVTGAIVGTGVVAGAGITGGIMGEAAGKVIGGARPLTSGREPGDSYESTCKASALPSLETDAFYS